MKIKGNKKIICTKKNKKMNKATINNIRGKNKYQYKKKNKQKSRDIRKRKQLMKMKKIQNIEEYHDVRSMQITDFLYFQIRLE